MGDASMDSFPFAKVIRFTNTYRFRLSPAFTINNTRFFSTPSIKIPVDLHYLRPGAVFRNYDAMLNQTNLGENNNKFFKMQIIVDESGANNTVSVFTRWGRVGEVGTKYTVFFHPRIGPSCICQKVQGEDQEHVASGSG